MELSTASVFSNSWLMQKLIVSSRVLLVKRESTSKLPLVNERFCSQISFTKWSESFTVYLFLLNVFNVGFNLIYWTLAWLYVRVCKADRIGLNGGQSSTSCFYTLKSPYIVPSIVPTGFIDLPMSLDILLEWTKFWKMVPMPILLLFHYKIWKSVIFKVTLSNVFWSLKRFPILLI